MPRGSKANGGIPSLAVGDRVVFFRKKIRNRGRVIAIEGKQYRVKLTDGSEAWARETNLEYIPTPKRIAADAAKLKRRHLALKRKQKPPGVEREGNPRTAALPKAPRPPLI